MFESFDQNTLETAKNFTEQERQLLFGAAASALRSRGTIIYPDPRTIYLDKNYKEYPGPTYIRAEVTGEELSAFGVPYDSLTVEIEADEIPDHLPNVWISARRMTTGTMPSRDGETSDFGFGYEEKYVGLTYDTASKIAVQLEADVTFRDGHPSERQLVTTSAGEEIELVGTPLFMDSTPLFTHQELKDITAALTALAP